MDELTTIPGLDLEVEDDTTNRHLAAVLAVVGGACGGALVVAAVLASGHSDGPRAADFELGFGLVAGAMLAVLGTWHGVIGRVRTAASRWDEGLTAQEWQRQGEIVLAFARRHPRLHRLRMRGLALVGRIAPVAAMELLWSLVVLSVLPIALGIVPSVLLLLLAARIGVWALQFTRALRVTTQAATFDGSVVVGTTAAPQLHALVEEVADLLGAQRPHEIAIGDGLEVRLRSWPTSWWQLRPRRRLTIGHALLSSLPVDELRAMVTLELGHVVNRGDEARIELASAQAVWLQAYRRLDRNESVPGILCVVAGWFLYRSHRMLLATGRVGERAADARVQDVVDPRVARRALLRTALLTARMERVQRDFFCENATKSTPPTGRARQVVAGLHAPAITRATLPSLLVHLLLDAVDTWHARGLAPSLVERCHDVGAPVLDPQGRITWPLVRQLVDEMLLCSPQPASARLLAGNAAAIGDRLDGIWMRRAAGQWRSLVSLALAADDVADGGQRRDAAHPAARVDMAVARIFDGQRGGWDDLRDALPAAPETLERTVPVLVRYCVRFGDERLAADLTRLLQRRRAAVAQAVLERSGLDWEELELSRCDLDELRARQLAERLESMPEVRRAWLVEHRFETLPGERAFALAIQTDAVVEVGDTSESYECRRAMEQLQEWIAHHLSRGVETWHVCSVSHVPSPVAERVASVPGARFHDRSMADALRDGDRAA